MATFRVGQRVRIVLGLSDFVGKEGTIISHGVGRLLGRSISNVWGVDVDGIGPRWRDGKLNGFQEDQIVPATDTYEKTTWAECAWQPKHLRERV